MDQTEIIKLVESERESLVADYMKIRGGISLKETEIRIRDKEIGELKLKLQRWEGAIQVCDNILKKLKPETPAAIIEGPAL